MKVDRAEGAFDQRSALEIVANREFIGNPHGTMQLDSALTDELVGFADLDLGTGNSTRPLGIVGQPHGGEIGHRSGLFDLNEHVDHTVLQYLER